ncbi:sensor histidine kinase [Haloglycomyces albus]|uniref:sensor histidine kinase n=1 Tax=Haloglycomyces albus TaxID=526067 RepID=UPI00046CE311|nr:sensor histidine kinase [Haloglycomyces albus]
MFKLKPRIHAHLSFIAATLALLVSSVLGVVLIAIALVSGVLVLFWVGIPLTLATFAAVREWSDWHRRLFSLVFDLDIASPYQEPTARSWDRRLLDRVKQAATWRDAAWLGINSTLGFLVYATLLAILVSGLYLTVHPMVNLVVDGGLAGLDRWGLGADHPWRSLLTVPVGLLLIASWLHWGRRLVAWYSRIAALLLGPTRAMRLARRVNELSRSRADTVEAAAAELRRIERDLHDGAQARLVALALNLGMAEQIVLNDPKQARTMVLEARQETQSVLAEIRDLVRGIYPPVLADRGLSGALEEVALEHPLPATLIDRAQVSLPLPLESAVYFAVNELLTNVTKYSRATEVSLTADVTDTGYRLEVTDNGIGGAEMNPGGGLEGIQRRLEAFDGEFRIASPDGGPTTMTLDVPCTEMKRCTDAERAGSESAR